MSLTGYVANYITKLRGLKPLNAAASASHAKVANYITKLRGLKRRNISQNLLGVALQIISQNYVV